MLTLEGNMLKEDILVNFRRKDAVILLNTPKQWAFPKMRSSKESLLVQKEPL